MEVHLEAGEEEQILIQHLAVAHPQMLYPTRRPASRHQQVVQRDLLRVVPLKACQLEAGLGLRQMGDKVVPLSLAQVNSHSRP